MRYCFHDRLSFCSFLHFSGVFFCLSVELPKYYCLDLLEKNQKMRFGPTCMPLKFESDLDHCLDTKHYLDFAIYLLLLDF